MLTYKGMNCGPLTGRRIFWYYSTQSTAQHSTAQHSTAQHSTAQHNTAHHSTPQHSTAQHTTAHHSTPQHTTAHYSTGFTNGRLIGSGFLNVGQFGLEVILLARNLSKTPPHSLPLALLETLGHTLSSVAQGTL
ncbi:per-pentamer repeat gene [Mus musculus]|jgi:hypothetical protein|uniref:Mp41 protein n=2 Tax=Mus TaxID=10088 RepID=Q78DZ5_MOUSE